MKTKQTLRALLVLLTLVGISTTVFARQGQSNTKKIVLRYNGQSFQGQQTLTLKAKFRQQYPQLFQRIMNRRAKLTRAILVAKSKHGGGQAQLKVGRNLSYSETIDGHPYDFNYNDPSTFYRTKFYNPNNNNNSQGVWQFKLRGKIKVKKVILFVKIKNQGHNGPLRFSEVQTFKVSKYYEETEYISVHQRASAVRIAVRKNDARITNVIVRYGNGSVENISNLEGTISDGDKKTARIGRNRIIEEIEVTASSNQPFGNRARITVLIGR